MSTCPYKPGEIYLMTSGMPARIYRNDAPGEWPIHGARINSDGFEQISKWRSSGGFYSDGIPHPFDLIPPERPRVKITRWLNIYWDGFSTYPDRMGADAAASHHRIARVAVTLDIPEGYGLDKDMPPIIVRGEK